ncbi:potassium channel family protein [Pseudomonadota bacterium]
MRSKFVTFLATSQVNAPWYQAPYFILTITLLLVTLLYPLARAVHSALLHDTVVNLMLLASLYAIIDRKWVFRTLGILLIPMLAANWFYEQGSILADFAAIATMLFLLLTTLSVLVHVIQAKRVNADMIYGSVAVYLLVGIIIALCFLFLHNMDPGSVVQSLDQKDPFGHGSDNFAVLLYFSFIALTSVGFGDLTPVSAEARSLTMFAGLFGQLYMAILIAKLVGVYTAQEMEKTKP